MNTAMLYMGEKKYVHFAVNQFCINKSTLKINLSSKCCEHMYVR